MNKEIIEFEIDTTLKEKVEEVLATQGISFETAIILFIEEVVKQGKIPFDITAVPNEETVAAIEESYNKDLPAIDGEEYLKQLKNRVNK